MYREPEPEGAMPVPISSRVLTPDEVEEPNSGGENGVGDDCRITAAQGIDGEI